MVGGEPVALDLVAARTCSQTCSRGSAQGYALDALAAGPVDPDTTRARAFLDAALFAPRADLPTPGLGRGTRLVAPDLVGSGLEHEGELIQLCTFPAQNEPSAPSHGTIARPSRRRR